jgi:hypothetical protein
VSDRPAPTFAHASEAEMARILDFYEVRWEYEPHVFPVLWNLDGDVTESFAPDFWLPDLGLYLEITTLRQRLVRRKNRKLRRVRELYPDLRVKLFYARDFRALMLKYGKLELAAELSGTVGQVPPVRLRARAREAPATPPSATIDATDTADDAPAAIRTAAIGGGRGATSGAARRRRARRRTARHAGAEAPPLSGVRA